jgi:hypothetical protein
MASYGTRTKLARPSIAARAIGGWRTISILHCTRPTTNSASPTSFPHSSLAAYVNLLREVLLV